MDASQSLASAVFLMFMAFGFMGAWDGLVRHHIRLRRGEWLAPLAFSGPAAYVTGRLCLLFLLFLGSVGLSGLPALEAGCVTPLCAVAHVLWSLCATPMSAFLVIVACGVFVPWLRGIRDPDGPFRTRLLAPGVWYREREVVTLAQHQLYELGKPDVDVDIILDLADYVVRAYHGVPPTISGRTWQKPLERPNANIMLARLLAHTARLRKRDGATLVAQRIITEAIALYVLEKLEAAEQRWPWRRRFFEIFP